jgi:hypothetical protein
VIAGAQGQVESVASTEDTISYQYQAHRGPAVGVAALSGGRIATIGADKDLRIWSAPTAQDYPSPGVGGADLDEFNVESPTTRNSARTLLALDPARNTLTYAIQSPGVLGVASSESLQREGGDFEFGSISTAGIPLIDGQIALFQQGGSTGVLSITQHKLEWQRQIAGGLPVSNMTAASAPDGDLLAYATPEELAAYGPTGPVRTEALAIQESPIAVLIDQHDRASVVTATGRWYRLGASTVTLPTGGTPLEAAALSRRGVLYLLNRAGDITRYSDGTITGVAHADPSLDGFALRLSPDATLVAVIGTAGTAVYSTATGEELADLPSGGADSSLVRDVALSDKTVWAMRASGELLVEPILDDATVIHTIAQAVPRAETNTERLALTDATTTIGEN